MPSETALLLYYLRKVSSIQRQEAELNTILPRVNNFDILNKKWLDIFALLYTPSTRQNEWMIASHSKLQQQHNYLFFFFLKKDQLQHLQLQHTRKHYKLLINQ